MLLQVHSSGPMYPATADAAAYSVLIFPQSTTKSPRCDRIGHSTSETPDNPGWNLVSSKHCLG